MSKKQSEDNAIMSWFPGHMAKSIKEIVKIKSKLDLVIEVVDARAPISSMNTSWHALLSQKYKVLVLSKSDLIDTQSQHLWKQYFLKNNYETVVLFNAKDNASVLSLSKTLEMIQKTNKKIGLSCIVLGIPNVGKTSLIAKLSKKKLHIGNRPSVNKNYAMEQCHYNDTPARYSRNYGAKDT